MYQIVEAKPEDFAEIVRLIEASFPHLESLKHILPKVVEIYFRSSGVFLLCKENSKLIGAGCIAKTAREPIKIALKNFFRLFPGRFGPISPWHFRPLFWDSGYFSFLAINPEFRGKKIGSLLFENILEAAKNSGIKSVCYETDVSNEAINKISRNSGFEIQNPLLAKVFQKLIWKKVW